MSFKARFYIVPLIWLFTAVSVMSEANPFTQDSFIKEATPAEIQLAISAGWDVNEPDPRYDEGHPFPTAGFSPIVDRGWG